MQHLFGEPWKLGVFLGPEGLILNMPVESGFASNSFDFPITEAEFAALREDRQRYDLLSHLLHQRLQDRMVRHDYDGLEAEILPLIRAVLFRGADGESTVRQGEANPALWGARSWTPEMLANHRQDWQFQASMVTPPSRDAIPWRPQSQGSGPTAGGASPHDPGAGPRSGRSVGHPLWAWIKRRILGRGKPAPEATSPSSPRAVQQDNPKYWRLSRAYAPAWLLSDLLGLNNWDLIGTASPVAKAGTLFFCGIEAPGPEVDVSFAGHAGVLVLSRRVSQELMAFHETFRRYPLRVAGTEGPERDVVQILCARDCIDMGRSQLTLFPAGDPDRPDLAGKVQSIVRLIIDPGRASEQDIFRITNAPNVIVVSDRVKRLLERIGATGCAFTQVSGPDATGAGPGLMGPQGSSPASGPGDPGRPTLWSDPAAGLPPARTKEHSRYGHLTLVRDWFLKPPRRHPPEPAIRKMHDYDIDMHLMGVSAACLREAAKLDLKDRLERQVGAPFASWLSDRRAAHALKTATREWIAAHCQDCLAGFPYADAGKTRDWVLGNVTEDVFWHLVCQEYGEDRAIALRNLTFGDPLLHAEFVAEGNATSARDFSFLLDRLEAASAQGGPAR